MPEEKSKEERINNLVKLFETMAEQFVALIDSNNKLLVENLRLMKENDQLRKESKGYVI
jgi:hypothetical protein